MSARVLTLVVFVLFLLGCGGGSSSGVRADTPPPAPPPTNMPPPASSSLATVPVKYQAAVRSQKTVSLEDVVDMDRTGQIMIADTSGNPRDPFDFSLLPNGRSDLPISVAYTGNQARSETAQGTLHVYQQPYSVVFGTVFTTDTGNEFIERPGDANRHEIEDVLGYRTPGTTINDLIAQNAIFHYSGVAFNGIDQGQLNLSGLHSPPLAAASPARFRRNR